MAARPITRRTLLAAGSGALAAHVLQGPAAALAALRPAGGATGSAPSVGSEAIGALAPGQTVTIALPRNADLVGMQWRGPAGAGLELRAAEGGGVAGPAGPGRPPAAGFGPWIAADGNGHGPDGATGLGGAGSAAASAQRVGEPLWTGGTRLVQVRSRARLADVRLRTVDVSDGLGAARTARLEDARAAGAPPLATSPLAAGPGVPPIIARRAWARGGAPPSVAPAYGEVRLAFVHHTENPNGYARGEVSAMLLAIYGFHRFVNGWNDIGYNFVVDRFGRIWEARAGGIEEPVVGAQAGGYNVYSTGIAVLGTFGAAPPSAAAVQAVERLLAWKLSLHGAPVSGRTTVKVTPGGARFSRFPAGAAVSLRRISGHRDGDATVCPGAALYALLPAIRARTQARTPAPSVLELALARPASASPPAAGASPASPAPPATFTVTGTLSVLGGAPLEGAGVAVQARRLAARGQLVQELTLAAATTDAQGAFAATLPVSAVPRNGLSLRAVYAGGAGAGTGTGAGRAAVSPVLELLPSQLSAPPATAPSAPAPAPPAA